MRIVPARLGDVAAVLQIERAIETAPHWAESEYRGIVGGEAAVVRRCLFVAWQGVNRVGFAVGKVVGDEAELESVAVCESARQGGIGRELCVAAIAWAREQGAAVMDLEVRAASGGAIALYKGLGFHELGRRARYYSDPVDDAILMRLGAAHLSNSC
jgi:ribosomal-protein-alanine N-acetyltransferase